MSTYMGWVASLLFTGHILAVRGSPFLKVKVMFNCRTYCISSTVITDRASVQPRPLPKS